MPFCEANGIRMYYEQSGEGPDLVCIGGLAVDHSMWDSSKLTKNFRVTTFDNRGMGRTGVPQGPYSIGLFAEDTVALCEALGMRRARFVGHSMGGHALQHIAALHPDLVEAAVIACSEHKFSIISELATSQQLALLECGIPKELWIRNYLPTLFSPGFLEQRERVETYVRQCLAAQAGFSPEGYRLQIEALRSHDTTHLLRKIRVPCLVLGAELDQLTPFRNSEFLANAIPNARLEKIAGSGHAPFVECPAEFYARIRAFFQ